MTLRITEEELKQYNMVMHVVHLYPNNSSRKERKGKYYLTIATVRQYLNQKGSGSVDSEKLFTEEYHTKRGVKDRRSLRRAIAVGKCLKVLQDSPVWVLRGSVSQHIVKEERESGHASKEDSPNILDVLA